MPERKFAVFSGFLGSGKTTSMIAIANCLEKGGVKTALISNDLGASNLVDGLYTAQNCCCSGTIAGGCICYKTEELVARIKRFTDVEGAKLVISDIPGCGVGALDHVYFKLSREYPGEFSLAPFTVICDPLRLRAIMPGEKRLRLPKEMDYLFRTQLLEADAIVLNKIDTVSEEERNACEAFLKETYPGIPVFAVCAKSGEGISGLAEYIFANKARLAEVDTGYGGAEFIAAESKLSWYDRRFYLKADKPFNGNTFAEAFFDAVAARLRAVGKNVPHLKLFAAGEENDYLKVSLIDVDCKAVFDRRADRESQNYSVCVNARAACESELLDTLMGEALNEAVSKFGVYCHVFSTECFGMTDEGA
jgi:G3E family GTPase